MTDIDWNVLSKQWADYSFKIGPVAHFVKGPNELSNAYRSVTPSFTITKRGEGKLVLDQHTYDLKPGTVVHSSADMWIHAWNIGDETFEFYRVLYTGHLSPGLQGKDAYRHYRLVIGECPHLYALLDQMSETAARGDIQSELQLKTLFYQFLNEMRLAAKKLQANDHRDIIEETIAYIHLHIQETHSLFSLASRCGMSPKYFAELFFKVAGVSPIHYIIRRRIHLAEKMLLTTNASIREIGKCVGYNDPYQFSKIFKKYRGVSPRELKASDRSN
ncbi:AraC family transcriptional regulator [Paenibacillus hemerocallicola]|uniref:AraC family transcriptional regulator n=1 Tax=Paenibacillus hemerocallicola TaxID=1172614 RepID=A0A5C4T4J0_9BACL|nr:AraC family transcriptional regulator [Paenibacillus hemerocallicola]TNJ63964.1 AraC family transcriptional regulator [Paenibacillus hemerocallicola]